MEFKLTTIDPHNCSLEELEEEIKRLSSMAGEYYRIEQSIKVFLNSVYGALGSPYFSCYNMYLAEAITLQGQNVSKYASQIIDDYFFNEWHLDKETHEKMGITYANKINEKTITKYMDTDSCYISFNPVLQSCDFSGNQTEFILKLKKVKLNEYLKKKFEEYAERYNTKNLQDLELEKISYSCTMLAKKKYILDLAWKEAAGDGIFYKPQEKIKYVGVEIVQGSTPKYARKVLKELQKTACQQGKNMQYADIVKRIKDYKKEYVMQNPDDIAKTMSIGDYEKYVLEDRKEIRLGLKCPINVRSAAVYNHHLLNSKWKTKYNLIKTGDKLKFYYTKDENQSFGFLPGNYPYEFAPPVDYDLQFTKTVIEPMNRVLEAMGYNPIPESLIYARSLF